MNEDFQAKPIQAEAPIGDKAEASAVEAVRVMFEEERDSVFFSRQIEVRFEDQWFHWITNRAIRDLLHRGEIVSERRDLVTGGTVHLIWHRSYRYYKRQAAEVVGLIESYAQPAIGAGLGLQGEALVLEGFARERFLMLGRSTREHEGAVWTETEHDLDFIFEKDGLAYGVEVKNTLQYMDYQEFLTKIRLARFLGLRPVFVVRMMPKSWIQEAIRAGGFVLVLKYQLYPWGFKDLADAVRAGLGLPVDTPRRLEDGTMQRFIRWHDRLV